MCSQPDLFGSNIIEKKGNSAKKDIKLRITTLCELIKKYDFAYYVEAESIISDREYDVLFRELVDLETEHPDLALPDSPTRRVGGETLKEFTQIRHAKPMLSLANTYSMKEIEAFDNRIRESLDSSDYQYVAELKFDGVALSLTYENCELKHAVTRGDGVMGDDVSLNIKTIRSLPLVVEPVIFDGKEIRNFEVRGEVYMIVSDFNDINLEREEAGEKIYANPRNLTAGTLKSLDSKQVAKRKLQIVCYYLDTEDTRLRSHYENIKLLGKMGFPIGEHIGICKDLTEVTDFLNKWDKERNNLGFEIDGVVLKLDLLRHQESLGFVARSPKWAVAYKYEAESAETILKDITLQVGRTGAITPVAELEPVFLSGSTISRATLHNADYIEKIGIRIGDTVIIQKGGEVIPKVVGVVIDKRPVDSVHFEFPELCPCELKSPIIRPEGEANHYCNHPECPWQIRRRIEHFAERNAMNIDGLGEKAVEQFVQIGLLKNIADVYELNFKRDELLGLGGWREKSIDNLIAGIEESKKQSYEKVLYAIGIRFIGEGAAKLLAKNFRTIEDLARADTEKLKSVHEIGDRMAESVFSFFADEKEKEIIDRLKKAGLQFEKAENAEESDNRFGGVTFVLTGELVSMPRGKAKEIIEKYGGRVSGSVSKKTGYVVVGADPGSKYENAVKLGLKILNEEEFLEIIK